jgi:hypothetical protein
MVTALREDLALIAVFKIETPISAIKFCTHGFALLRLIAHIYKYVIWPGIVIQFRCTLRQLTGDSQHFSWEEMMRTPTLCPRKS